MFCRHALLEAQVDNCITNDITSGGEDKPRVMIITGPNACGKSIYLKQVNIQIALSNASDYVTEILEKCSDTLSIVGRPDNKFRLAKLRTFLERGNISS